ncbi:leucyl/phenylalanyl-tRNA--protein transferase [soil metagenome]
MTKGPAILTYKLWFPPTDDADHEGLIAIGGDLGTERLLMAYRNGIFPWYDGSIPLWWCPDPRFVLYPDELKVSKSMRQILNRQTFEFTSNKDFEAVIANCKTTYRPGQDGTWISDVVKKAYTGLNKMGIARSYEAWHNNQLAGGLYGVKMGNIFFGESMFSHESNASKAALIYAVEQLKKEGIVLIDCQVYTGHLESLGARFITRKVFLEILEREIDSSINVVGL